MTEQERSEQTAVTPEESPAASAAAQVAQTAAAAVEQDAQAASGAAEQAKETVAAEADMMAANAVSAEKIAEMAAKIPPEQAVKTMQAAIAASEPDEDEQDTRDRLFTLRFKIPLEDYLTFYRLMTAGDEQKNKKKMTIVGGVEIVIGIIYLIMALTGVTQSSVFTYIVCLMLLLMGFYGLTYYKYFYQGSLTRSVTKQYDKTPYFHSTMTIDFYPNRSVEHIGDQLVENLWSRIDSIKVSESAYMIMVDAKRCMLIPKGQIFGQTGKMDSLIELICENYEKKRYDV